MGFHVTIRASLSTEAHFNFWDGTESKRLGGVGPEMGARVDLQESGNRSKGQPQCVLTSGGFSSVKDGFKAGRGDELLMQQIIQYVESCFIMLI